MMTATAGTKGFLFCDLRGYTAFIEAKGDRAAAELLESYRALVRSVIAAQAGAEIKTEGDSVYVVFPAASSAVEAGLGIVDGAAERSTRERPIRVGVGIHAGETVATDEGLVGGAVNIAARVCAKAQAGEVLVTDTVRALTRTALPYTFVGLGRQSLKGIDGGIALYRVEATPASRAAHLRRRLVAHRRLVAGVVAILVVGLVGATAAWAVNRPPDCLTLGADTADIVARIDPERMCVIETIAVGRHPDSIVATADAVWVANEDDWTVTRIDLASREAAPTLGSPGRPISLAIHADGQVDVLAAPTRSTAGGSISNRLAWLVGSSSDPRIEARDLPISPMAPSVSPWIEVAASNEWTWIAGPGGAVMRLSQGGGDRTIVMPDLTGIDHWITPVMAATSGTVWVADESEPKVFRFDGLASVPVGVALAGTSGTRAAVATTSELWLLRTDESLTVIGAATGNPQTIALDAPATEIAAGLTSLWLLDDGLARTVREVDPGSGRTLGTVEVGGLPGNAVFAGGFLWVTIHAP
jgi:class 3 adenylate cyclase/DNA-binding beta-propeller fold protein YncE